MLTHITVTAPEGRKTPIAPNDGVDPGAMLLYVDPGTVCRVRYSADVRRAIGRGDLVPCDKDGRPVAELELAACPQQLEEVIEGHAGGDRCELKVLAARRAELAEARIAAAEAAAAAAPRTELPTTEAATPDVQAPALHAPPTVDDLFEDELTPAPAPALTKTTK